MPWAASPCIVVPMDTTDRYMVRYSKAGEFLDEDRDFSDDGRFEWFDQAVQLAEIGETIELVDLETGVVLETVTKEAAPKL